MEVLKFNLQGTILEIPKTELELVLLDNWYLSNLINSDGDTELYKKNGYYLIYEDVQVFKDIIDSLRYRSLIITDKQKIKYYYQLCEKWCVPEWLLKELAIKEKTDEMKNDVMKNIFTIKKCINCFVSFKEEENHNKACQFHPISLDHSNTFKCCGYNTYNPPSENNYCREGYHMSDVQQDLNLLEKILRMDI